MLPTADALGVEWARRRLDRFVPYMDDALVPAHHHRLLIEQLHKVDSGELKRLMVFWPPGHAKSKYSSEYGPAWLMGRAKKKTIIHATYGTDFAERFGRKIRNIMRTPEYERVFGVTLAADSRAAGEWETIEGGEYKAAGVGAGITGRRADCVVGNAAVITYNGPKQIKEVSPGEFVLSYSEKEGRPVYRKVVAVAGRIATETWRIHTALGGVVEATGNHRIYCGADWKAAAAIADGDVLLRLLPEAGQSGELRTGEEAARGSELSPGVFPELRHAVEQCGARHGPGKEVQELRIGTPAGKQEPDLFGAVSIGTCKETRPENQDCASAKLRRVRQGIPAAIGDGGFAVLFDEVQERSSRDGNGGGEQSGMEGWRNTGERASQNTAQFQDGQAQRHEDGRRHVRGVQFDERPGSAPHKSHSDRQSLCESGDAVRTLPHQAARHAQEQAAPDAVSLVERVRHEAGIAVYDIEVEDTHNFFADGILVHNCGLIDDPVKSRKEADSPTYRQNTWDWYLADFRTRLKPGGAIIIIQTRWHEDDLSGRILPKDYDGRSGLVTARDGEQWFVLNFPALCEREDDLTGRKIGEPLWPGYIDLQMLLQLKATQGSRNWDSLYQQRPRPTDGGIFKEAWVRNRYGVIPAAADVCVHSWDTAQKPGELNDPSVMTAWRLGRGVPGYYLADVFRDQVDYPTLKRKVVAFAERDKPAAILIEDKSSGQSLIQELRATTTLPIIAIEPLGDKTFRANEVSAMVEAGLMHLPEPGELINTEGGSLRYPWLVDFEGEFFGFPLTTNDDQVDSVTQFLKWVRNWSGRIESHAAGMTRAAVTDSAASTTQTSRGFGSVSRGADMSGF